MDKDQRRLVTEVYIREIKVITVNVITVREYCCVDNSDMMSTQLCNGNYFFKYM